MLQIEHIASIRLTSTATVMNKIISTRLSGAANSTGEYVTKADVANRFNTTPRTINNWMTAKVIPFYRFGYRTVRFKLSEVEAALTAKFRVGGAQ
jgi:excisionase family DNA binding protein